MLRESLANYKPAEFPSTISVAFIDLLPRDEVLSLLRKRRTAIEEMLSVRSGSQAHHGGFSDIIEHTVRHPDTGLKWLDEVIARL